jgi:NAD(P)-dependent dehydrogenase (short-subunit alcohol dehydrogenase family)
MTSAPVRDPFSDHLITPQNAALLLAIAESWRPYRSLATAYLFSAAFEDAAGSERVEETIGAFELGDSMAATPDGLRRMLDVNLGTALWLSQAVAPYMQQLGSGAIVHVTARPALEPTAGMAAYSLSKAALVHLVRVLDVELRPSGIRVNAVAPQLLNTAITRSSFPPEVIAHAVAPEVIAGLIGFLVSDAAAPVSGAVLPAYGG